MANGQLNLGKQSGGVLSVSFPDGVTNTEVVLPESGTVVSIDGSVTDNAIAIYDGTTGKLQNSNVTIDDSGYASVNKIYPILESDANSMTSVFNGSLTLFVSDFNIPNSPTNWGFVESRNRNVGSGSIYNTQTWIDIFGNKFSRYNNSITGWSNWKKFLSSEEALVTSPTGAFGYGTGAGGTVTQLTSKSTGITVNKPSGTIYTHNESLAAGASVSFTFNNNLLNGYSFGDTLVVGGAYTSTTINPDGLYRIESSMVGSGGARIRITNITGAARAEVIAINFSIVKGARG